jgi:hypothetical protein
MTKKRPATGKRRGQWEDRPVKTAPLRARQPRYPKDPVTSALKADFDATHIEGMRALDEHDFERVSKAIDRERRLIGEQKKRIATQRAKQATCSK